MNLTLFDMHLARDVPTIRLDIHFLSCPSHLGAGLKPPVLP